MSKASEPSALAKTIKIIAIPKGEPLPWVREAWIGCVFPCLPECGDVPIPVAGVVSGESDGYVSGFSVPQDAAIAVLEKRCSTAAIWWREYGYPQQDQYFRFRREECEVVEFLTREEAWALPGPVDVWDEQDRTWMPRG